MRLPLAAAATLLATLAPALGARAVADDEKQAKPRTVEVEGISFDVPEAWTSSPPTSAMRKAQIRVKPVEGDSDPAELVLFVFPGGAGTVESNVERWRKQFTDDAGDTPDVERKTVKGQNAEVTRVEVGGTYKDPFAPGGPKEGYRLLGAIVQTDKAGYFFKMVGPEKTMAAAEPAFDKLLSSIKISGK
jgi:hypothetical protein